MNVYNLIINSKIYAEKITLEQALDFIEKHSKNNHNNEIMIKKVK